MIHEPVCCTLNAVQCLNCPVSHWNYQAAADGQLIEQRIGGVRCGGRNNDRVERCCGEVTLSAVTDEQRDVLNADLLESYIGIV